MPATTRALTARMATLGASSRPPPASRPLPLLVGIILDPRPCLRFCRLSVTWLSIGIKPPCLRRWLNLSRARVEGGFALAERTYDRCVPGHHLIDYVGPLLRRNGMRS